MPLDVGAPTYTNRTFSVNVNGGNFSTALRVWIWDDNAGGIADEDFAAYFTAPSGIHNQSTVVLGAAPSGAQAQCNLHLLNPIGYNNKIITQVLLDFLVEQMHIGCGIARVRPTGDGTGTWAASTGGAKWACIDEQLNEPGNTKLNDYISANAAAAAQGLTFPTLPSNALNVHEAIVCFIGLMTKGPSGSDEGLGFGFEYHNNTVGAITRKLIGDMYADGSVNAQRVKLDRLNGATILASAWNNGFLKLTAEYGTAGPSPNPYWRVHALEMLVYYDINEPTYYVIDQPSFSNLTPDYTSATNPLGSFDWLLDFDIIDTTGYSALLDILAHAPQLFLYVDYLGRLKLAQIGAYADTASPRVLSTVDGSILEVQRGPYWYDERAANQVELRWGVTIPHSGSGGAVEDPTNPPADRGSRKYRRGADSIPVAGWEDIKILDRHFVRRDSNKDVAETMAKMYLHLWGKSRRGVKAMDLSCPYSCVDVEPGDVVAVTVPALGMASKRFLCVEKSFDLDRDRMLLTVYDLENTL